MGKSITIPVTVEMKTMTATGSQVCTPSEWRTRERVNAPGYGTPNAENLATYIKKFEDSTKPGGVNEHLGVTVVTSALIKRQATGAILATYTGPSFVVF